MFAPFAIFKSSTFASPYGEYNPNNPGNDRRQQQAQPSDQNQTTLITVDRSRYSVKNTLYRVGFCYILDPLSGDGAKLDN